MATSTQPAVWLAAVMNSRVSPSGLPLATIIDLNELSGASASETGDETEDESETSRRRFSDFTAAIAPLDRDASTLEIVGDTPTDREWKALETHFRRVRQLRVECGFEERWIDGNFPLTWPLELLVLSSATGELVSTPAVVEGRVEHLVLELTCGLKFGAPSTDELVAIFDNAEEPGEGEAIRGDKKLDEMLRITPNRPSSSTKTLEILENDAMETFARFAFAQPNVVLGLEHLNLRSAMGLDMTCLDFDVPLRILPKLANLKCLKLSLGDSWREGGDILNGEEERGVNDLLASLHKWLPRNLEVFHFRGPAALAQNLEGWVSAFKDLGFLPSLKAMSFVLDLSEDARNPHEVGEEDLKAAKVACQSLLDVASARGIEVLEFTETWAGTGFPLFEPVDERWAGLLLVSQTA